MTAHLSSIQQLLGAGPVGVTGRHWYGWYLENPSRKFSRITDRHGNEYAVEILHPPSWPYPLLVFSGEDDLEGGFICHYENAEPEVAAGWDLPSTQLQRYREEAEQSS